MTEFTNDHSEPEFMDSETALGGADAVPKTTYIVGEGTDPNARSPVGRPARVGNRGVSPVLWGIVGLLVLVALVFAFGAFKR